MMPVLRPALATGGHFIEIVWQLSRTEMKTRYFQRSLSYLWWVIEPMLLAATFFFLTLVLAGGRRPGAPDYAEMFMGIVMWNWFRAAANAGMVSLIGGAGIIKQIRFPPLLLFFSRVLTETFNFLISLALTLVVFVAFGKPIFLTWLQMPIGLAVQFLLTLAVGVWLSFIGVFLRDTVSFVNFALNLVMYVSPVVYREELVPARYRRLVDANPFTPLMRVYRNTLVDGRAIDNWGALALWSLAYVVVFLAGIWLLRRVKRKLYRFL